MAGLQPGGIRIKLVDACPFGFREKPVRHGLKLPMQAVVQGPIGRNEDQLGTESQGLDGRHGGMDPEPADFIAGGGDDAARRRTTDRDRFPCE